MLYLLNIIIYHSYVAYVALAEGLLAFGAQPQFAQMDSHLYIISQTFQTKGRVGPKRAAMGRLTQWDLSGSIAFFFFRSNHPIFWEVIFLTIFHPYPTSPQVGGLPRKKWL